MQLSKTIRLAAPILQALTFSSITVTKTSALTSMTSSEASRQFSTTVSPSSGGVAAAKGSNDSLQVSTPALDKARVLQLPSSEEVLRRDLSVRNFWNQNDELLEQAWKEWQTTDEYKALPKLDSSLIHPKLREVVDKIWKSVESGDSDQVGAQELLLKDLFEEVAPGVYSVQFFDLEKISVIQQWFHAAAKSGIPIRPPFGIVLNRMGFMIDPASIGYWAAPGFQTFYKDILIDSYVRPISRLFFPDSIVATDDSETFAFSIQYQEGGDESIRHHQDASTITFNINLDEEKLWTGSSLYFWESLNGGTRYTVDWAPGKAVMHLGRTLHAALPIESGIRNNMVMWTMGKDGGGGYGGPLTTGDGKYPEEHQLSREQRWEKPVRPRQKPWDRWSPF